MKLSDSRDILAANHELLQEIESLYNDSLHLDDVPVKLTVKVKNFLENARSPLDYAANYLFDTYCVRHIPDPNKIPRKKRRVVFPIDDTEKTFQNTLRDKLPGLQQERPDVVAFLESYQPFNSIHWIKRLRDLANSNKHIELTRQERKILSRTIQIGRVSFTDCHFGDSDIDIMIGNTPISIEPKTQLPLQSHPEMQTTAIVDFYFKSSNEPVLPLLKDIHSGTSTLIDDLEKNL